MIVTDLHGVHIAPRIKDHLPRPRLMQKLHGVLQHKVTLLCASAGAGKTTLLQEFASKGVATTAWYAMERTDRDPVIFASRMLQAMARSTAPKAPPCSALIPVWEPDSLTPQLVRALRQATAAAREHLVVVLDDYHKLGACKAVNRVLAGVIDAMPGDAHILLSSRTAPALPLSRLRLSGGLLEVTQEDLAFDADETTAYLVDHQHLPLTEQEVRLILNKTRGWVAGLSMFSQSVKNREKGELIAFLRDFDGGDRVVYDYFAEEVLQQQSSATRAFLISTSLLHELHRDVVNPVLNIGNAQEILETLEANNVFVAAMEDNRHWYKYHPLFREFLTSKAERSLSPDSLLQIHRRAAAAYASLRNWGRAVDHLCAAGRFTEAADIIEREGYEHIDRGNLETVGHWLDSLPGRIKGERPWLLALEGRICQRQGNYRQSSTMLAEAQTLFAARGDRNGLARVAAEQAAVYYRTGEHRKAIEVRACAAEVRV